MKIAIITPVLGSAGGMGRIAEEHASRLRARGHEVTVFCPSTNLKSRLRYGHGAWVPDLTKLLADFSLVHLHYPFLGGVSAVLKWRKLVNQSTSQPVNRKLVITYHMDLLGRGIFRPVFRAYQKFILPKIIKVADQVLVSSIDYAENSDLKPYMEKIKNKLVELPFGIDTERFAPHEPDAALLTELGIASDESVILFVGGLNRAHYFKGVPELIRAFTTLARESTKIRLVLVGSGDRLKNYQKLTRQLKIDKYVVFANAVTPEALPRYYSLADVLVLPSTDRSEAFGLVLLEAQASSVPVIASDLPGVRTVFEDQKTGLLVPPGDTMTLMSALAWILTHRAEHESMRRAARARMEEKYRWDPIIDRLEGVYQDLLSSRGAPKGSLRDPTG